MFSLIYKDLAYQNTSNSESWARTGWVTGAESNVSKNIENKGVDNVLKF